MISVNQKFIDSCNSDYVLSQIKIRVSTNKVGTILCTLNDDEFNISSNSVEKQASSGAVCNIGGVCSNRIKVIINQKGIEKLESVNGFNKNNVLHIIQWNKVDDAQQNPNDFSLNLDDSENETGKCDLGFYYISQIKNNYYDCEITAYDGMLAFEKNLTISQLKYMMTNSKTVDEWLAYLCTLVNDSNFNISYTDNTEVTCNDGIYFKLSDDSSFDKIRDAISQLAQLKMAYATINAQGNLTLKQAIKTNTSSYDESVDNEYMFNCDNEVKESVVKLFYTSVAGFEYENTYKDEQGRNEINLFLEENKFLRGFEPYNGTALSSNTLTCLRNMSLEVMGYSFYSCECDINNRPYIELGDNVEVQRKLVDQQGTTTIMSIPCVVDSVSHEIGASTHLTSNSTVGTNEGSNTKTRINSQPKDPSTSSILNMLKSPVTKYTDETATVSIRLDNTESETFDQKKFADALTPDLSYETHQVGSISTDIGYLLTNIESVNNDNIFDRAVQEYLDKSYFYKIEIQNSQDIKSSKLRYNISLNIANLSSVIGKKFLFFATNSTTSYHKDPVEATLTGIYFYRGEYYSGNFSNLLSRANTNVETRQSNPYTAGQYEDNFVKEIFNSVDTYTRIDTGISAKKQKAESGVLLSESPYAAKRPNGFSIVSDIGTGVVSPGPDDTVNRLQLINAKSINMNVVKQLIKYWLLCGNITLTGNTGGLFNTHSFIALRLEYDFNGQHYDIYAPLNLIMAHLGFGEVPTVAEGTTTYNGLNAYNYIDTWIRSNSNSVTYKNYLDLLQALYEGIVFNWYELYLEVTYLTRTAPLSQYDKDKVDIGVVTQNDLEGLREQVRQNTDNIEALNNYINEVNNDLQDAKGDITHNTQDIAQHTADIAGLDNRVTALEQGGGGGTGTFVAANPEGTPAQQLNSLQVGSDIYSLPAGQSELIVTSTNLITVTKTPQKYICNKKVFESGSNFINYNQQTGDFSVNSDCLVEIEVEAFPNQFLNGGWFFLKLYENDGTEEHWLNTVGVPCSAIGPNFKFPIVKLKRGKTYYICPNIYNNNGSIDITATSVNTYTNDYTLWNFIKFTLKSGTYYTPST